MTRILGRRGSYRRVSSCPWPPARAAEARDTYHRNMRGRPPVFGPAAYRMSSLLLILRPPQPQPRPRGRSPPQRVGWFSATAPAPGVRLRRPRSLPCPALPCPAVPCRRPPSSSAPGRAVEGAPCTAGRGGRPSRGPGWLPACARRHGDIFCGRPPHGQLGERARGEGGRRRRWATAAAELWMHRLLWQKKKLHPPPPNLGRDDVIFSLAVALTLTTRGSVEECDGAKGGRRRR